MRCYDLKKKFLLNGLIYTYTFFQLRKYKIRNRESGGYLNFRLCDTRGLEGENSMHYHDMQLLLDGYLTDQYKARGISSFYFLVRTENNKIIFYRFCFHFSLIPWRMLLNETLDSYLTRRFRTRFTVWLLQWTPVPQTCCMQMYPRTCFIFVL